MSHPFDLTGKRILITGASSGIGRAVAIECSKLGAELILLGRNEERLIETLGNLSGKNHSYAIFDFANKNDFEGLNEMISAHGKLSGLVHCAGVTSTLPLKSISDERLKNTFESNVFGAFDLTKWFTKKSIIKETGGSIVFIASVMGIVGEVGKSLYAMTKGALISGSKSMALELAPRKIRVNCISPGVVLTPMVENGVYANDEKLFQKVKDLHPLGLGNPEDIAHSVSFLLCDASQWITGTNLIIDGGYSAH
jgi:NAD(P)-dependent dehydrogenase (short-subunit alcohol dehydrogenase family)